MRNWQAIILDVLTFVALFLMAVDAVRSLVSMFTGDGFTEGGPIYYVIGAVLLFGRQTWERAMEKRK
ncbi:hypothetical protein B7W85_13035 [Allorhizobium ampelinum]|nr:hypothetical protein B7W85_13035 [Allorhizobium ampelinum]